MKRTLFAAPLAALTLILAAGLAFADDSSAKAKQARIGEPAPDFTLKDQNGNDVSLSDYKGKIVVIEQFNQQCPYVQKFYREGHMNRFAEKYADQNVVWLAIDSTGANAEQSKAIAEKWNINRPLLIDNEQQFARTYDSKTSPQMRVIDADGILRYSGAIDDNRSANTSDIDGAKNYVVQAVDELLAGESVSEPETKPYGCGVKL